MKYLLLGGAGFIGTHLAKKLQSLNHDVVIIDNLSTGIRPNWDVKFIHADVSTFIDIEQYIADADIVYFLAGSIGVEYIDKNPKYALNNNINLMSCLIPHFEKYQKKVIFSSTSEVYGDGPFIESGALHIGPPTKLRWAYAAAKLMTEFAVASNTFPYTIIRFFNIVGPGQLPDYGMVLPKFIKSAKLGEDIKVYGTGEQIRSFCHVSDAVDALIKLEKYNNEIFNIGADEPVSMNQLAQRVKELTNCSGNIVHIPYENVFSNQHADILSRIPDLSKLYQAIDYEPKYNLDHIIKDCL